MEEMVYCKLPTLGPVSNERIDPLSGLSHSAQHQDNDSNKLNCEDNSAKSTSDSQQDNASEVTEPCPIRNSVKKGHSGLMFFWGPRMMSYIVNWYCTIL